MAIEKQTKFLFTELLLSKLSGLLIVLVILVPWIILTGPPGVFASQTMLMFVGEDLDVLTIASKREEAAWSAPAIAGVMARNDIRRKGADTIAQALEDSPGFFMNQTEKGSIPYLRGIPDSALFLFDTVPIGSGISKSDHNIDGQISLASVKRIEIIRGTGSVLWGADAFAGVVNIVPLSGQDFQGVETGVIFSSNETLAETYVNWGQRFGTWSSFLSISGRGEKSNNDSINTVKFWGDGTTPEPLETRYGSDSLDDSHYLNVYANLACRDWLTLSMNLTDNKHAYAVTDWDEQYSWEEQSANSGGMIKLEAVRQLGPNNGIRFTGYHAWNSQDLSYIDNTFETQASSWYGEVIYDHAFFTDNGLFTLGISLRRDRFNDIPVWEGYLPDYITWENSYFLPVVDSIDIENTLKSVFTQYRHNFGKIEVWAGIRYDNHENIEDKNSYNTGFAWNMGDFIFKTIYGTAYRTPSAGQLLENGGEALEKIGNVSTQLSWRKKETRASITFFNNRIDSHVSQDRYAGAGFSTPNSQTINGLELDFSVPLNPFLSISGNMTFLDNNGANETYLYNDYSYIDNDGNEIKHYETLEYEYDSGPKRMGNLKLAWKMSDHFMLAPELRYFSKRTLYSPVKNESKNCPETWIMNLNFNIEDMFPFDMSLFVDNLFDNQYLSPGLYSITRSKGFTAGFNIRFQW